MKTNRIETINNVPCIVLKDYKEMEAFLKANPDYEQFLGTAVYMKDEQG